MLVDHSHETGRVAARRTVEAVAPLVASTTNGAGFDQLAILRVMRSASLKIAGP